MTDQEFESTVLPMLALDAKRLKRLELPDLFRALAMRLEAAPPLRGLAEERKLARDAAIVLAGALVEAGVCRR